MPPPHLPSHFTYWPHQLPSGSAAAVEMMSPPACGLNTPRPCPGASVYAKHKDLDAARSGHHHGGTRTLGLSGYSSRQYPVLEAENMLIPAETLKSGISTLR